LPASAWRDAPAFGVYSHKKPDGTALRLADETGLAQSGASAERTGDDERAEQPDATALAGGWVTETRVRAVRDRVDDPTVDRVGTAAFDRLVRARFPTVVGSSLDPEAVRDAVVARVARTWDTDRETE
jgi:hypothetical protein